MQAKTLTRTPVSRLALSPTFTWSRANCKSSSQLWGLSDGRGERGGSGRFPGSLTSSVFNSKSLGLVTSQRFRQSSSLLPGRFPKSLGNRQEARSLIMTRVIYYDLSLRSNIHPLQKTLLRPRNSKSFLDIQSLFLHRKVSDI